MNHPEFSGWFFISEMCSEALTPSYFFKIVYLVRDFLHEKIPHHITGFYFLPEYL